MKHCFVFIFFTLLLFIQAVSQPKTYYVAANGSDSNTGLSIDQPFATISKAVGLVVAGDTIYVRGGTYSFTGSSTAITLPSISGTSETIHCNLIGYHGERALLDFSAMTGTNADGLKINGNYWYIKGLDCKGAPHNGIKISGGNYNTIEFCSSFENRNTGVQLSTLASYNRFINCDSYHNYDAPDGGNADGFSPKLDCGTHNYFYGCRSYQNSDDGWDGYVRPATPVAGKDTMLTFIENCWSFQNGWYWANGSTTSSMNGNGFKMGGGNKNQAGTISNADSLRHDMILKNCLSFDNKANGFDQNNNRGSMTLYNCTGYCNGGYNFGIAGFIRVGDTLSVKNCISLPSSSVTLAGVPNPILATNSWLSPFANATAADFVSLDTTGVRGPRKSDGSLPDITFMHLAQGSQFIDAGTRIGISFNGSAPDLGCFESAYVTSVEKTAGMNITGFQLLQNYPNPFNPSTNLQFLVPATGYASLKVYNVLGQEVATLFSGMAQSGHYITAAFNGSQMSSGVYFARLQYNGKSMITKMLMLK
jgi:hypothetical protein